MFDSHSYDRDFFEHANREFEFKIEYHECQLNAETAWKAKGAEAVCVFVNDQVDDLTLEVLKELKVKTVALRCAGFDNVDMDHAKKLGIRVVRVAHYSPHSVAEHAVAMILSLSRKLNHSNERVRHGNYSLEGLLGFELHGKTVGILGTGGIGEIVAKIMHGFGCHVLAYDCKPNLLLEEQNQVCYQELNEVLVHSDIVSLHLPLDSSTRHILGKAQFDLMKTGSMLINIGRGGLVDSRALIDSLKSGKIGYAGLDVYEREAGMFFYNQSEAVLQDDVFARLLSFQNVLITPHQAFFTREALAEIALTTLKNIQS